MEVLVALILIWLFVPSRHNKEPDRQEELYRERDRYINRRKDIDGRTNNRR